MAWTDRARAAAAQARRAHKIGSKKYFQSLRVDRKLNAREARKGGLGKSGYGYTPIISGRQRGGFPR